MALEEIRMVIKCKMCGGDLHPEEGNTTCECEFCGTVQTIPRDNGEKKTNLFNRANRLRMNAEFDKASAIYESIAAEFPEEAEAYWGLCLCAYGIEYVDDPATGEKKPTCHRTLPTSIMEDSNFEQACDNADTIARRVYREEAKAIDRIQKDILSIVSSEKPYDVFICYKETAEEGGRTEDSVLAQEIYDALTEKGLKVFFSRITLEDKLGQQYEPYIYAALSSAKVMLAVGTKFEYYDSAWVKNEWSRFLSMMKTDKSKTLIPCYKELDVYDIPKEFKNLQGQDMGKIGALQDLVRGIEKILSASSESQNKEDIEKRRRIDNLRTLAKRAKDADDGRNAIKYYDELAIEDPHDWESVFYPAYFNSLNQISGPISDHINGALSQSFHLIADNLSSESVKKACDEIVERMDSLIASRASVILQYAHMGLDNDQQASATEDLDLVILMFATGLTICREYDAALHYLTSAQNLTNIMVKKSRTQGIAKAKFLIDAAIEGIEKKRDEENDARNKEEEQAKQKRIADYWASHAEEKKKYEDEIATLNKQIAGKQEKIKKIPESDNIIKIESQIDKLNMQKNALGLFKLKEKRTIQNQIEDCNREINRIQEDINAAKMPIEKEIISLENRKKKIQDILTKDR